MSTLNIKLSQSVINKNHQLDDGSDSATIGDMFATNVTIKKEVMDVTYWSHSLRQSGNKFTFSYANGIQKVMTGSVNYADQTAVATQSVVTIPGALKETVTGTINMVFELDDGYPTIYDTGGVVRSYLAEGLQNTADFGRISSGFTGNLVYNASYDLSGTISTLTLSAQKHLKEVKVEGVFNVSGNMYAIAAGTTPIINGTATRYKETYIDGSYVDFAGLLISNQNTSFDLDTLADESKWTLPDTFNIDLPKTLYEDWILNTGNGNDRVTLKGGGGRLFVNTGADDDYVVLHDSAPIVDGGNGTDTLEIHFSGGLNMPNVSNFENLVLGGKGNINGTGNAQNNVITGNDGKNTLDGGGGVNTLIGGKGDDTYIIRDTLDSLVETADGGKKDLVLAHVSYTLADNIENLTLAGAGDINGTGNMQKNIITGNAGSNTLDGGGGIDTLIGGGGDDVYIVRDIKDKVTEKKDEGHDRIDTTVNKYSIAKLAEIEDLAFIGGGDAHLTGNAKSNALIGSTGNDTLDGGKGIDRMTGGEGDDVYIIDDFLDSIVELENEGYDKAFSSVTYTLSAYIEELVLTGKAHINGTGNHQDNVLIGNNGNNSLAGFDGNDIIDGLGGNDAYLGGAGNDIFRLSTAPNAKSNVKTIVDFVQGEDAVEINAAAFKWKDVPLGALLAENFGSNADGIAETETQRLVYNNTTGQLFYDADGSGRGKAVLVAVFENAPDLQHTDITLY